MEEQQESAEMVIVSTYQPTTPTLESEPQRHFNWMLCPAAEAGIKAGDVIKVGKRVELECMDTPGHTMCHICLRSHTDQPALFSCDTLFNAGAGNCHNGGDPGELYATFANQLAKLPADTRIFPYLRAIVVAGHSAGAPCLS
jgi:glyoxylase-like metal-dependent hydrolase (beta-lactamase superfamily II)